MIETNPFAQGEIRSEMSEPRRKILKQQYPDVADSQLNSIKIGKAMKEMKVARVKSKRGVSYSLVKLAA